MFVQERFALKDTFKIPEPNWAWGYGAFSQFIYYNNYSRLIDGKQEQWRDTVVRVINGVMSIRKDHYVRNRIEWSESYWQAYASQMAISLSRMEWLPPGRGLWAMGTDLIYNRGAMALYNCAYTEIGDDWIEDIDWFMNTLMHGVGVGFSPVVSGVQLNGVRDKLGPFIVEDSREGWCASVATQLDGWFNGYFVEFDYSQIRPAGSPIKTFGGIASGPEPLKRLHEEIDRRCHEYWNNNISETQWKTDLANLIGVCVITGNVRRSAEIAVCEVGQEDFESLKDYRRNPERAGWGWMSNNSVRLRSKEDFEFLGELALHNIQGHDLGYLNMKNMRHGRIGKMDDVPVDKATGINPCGEIPLESREVCNLSETCPTRCADKQTWLRACEFATFYSSTVALLPTHQPSTNAIVTRNRRIGVSIIDITGWKDQLGLAAVTTCLREGYDVVRRVNAELADEAGVPRSIRVTTVKPGGTVPKLAGRVSGIGHPTFKYTRRRVNVRKGAPVEPILIAAGVPYEESVYTPETTNVFEFPIEQGPARPATEVSLWEQALNVVWIQREWADNAVSNTLYFKPKWRKIALCDAEIYYSSGEKDPRGLQKGYHAALINGEYYYSLNALMCKNGETWEYNPNHEEDQISDVLAHIAPYTKSISLLPHSDVGLFAQMPEEGLSYSEYQQAVALIRPIDWSDYFGSDGQDEKYCTGDTCQPL